MSRPVVAFFRRLDDAVAALAPGGIQADVLIFNAYDRGQFGFDRFTEAEDAAYLRYLVARLSAYPNVWWSLCNEFDQLERARPDERWTRVGALLAEIDPHDHRARSTTGCDLYDNNRSWVTHASIQNGRRHRTSGGPRCSATCGEKPVVLDEIKYEGDIPERWGYIEPQQLVHQFWIATVAGLLRLARRELRDRDGSLHMVEGGALPRGESPARLAFLRRRSSTRSTVAGLDPIDNWWDDRRTSPACPGEQYLQYLGRSAPASW